MIAVVCDNAQVMEKYVVDGKNNAKYYRAKLGAMGTAVEVRLTPDEYAGFPEAGQMISGQFNIQEGRFGLEISRPKLKQNRQAA